MVREGLPGLSALQTTWLYSGRYSTTSIIWSPAGFEKSILSPPSSPLHQAGPPGAGAVNILLKWQIPVIHGGPLASLPKDEGETKVVRGEKEVAELSTAFLERAAKSSYMGVVTHGGLP